MVQKRGKTEMYVNRTISMPIGMMNAVSDEAFNKHDTFSGQLVALLRLGLTYRRMEEEHDKEQYAKQTKKDIERMKEISKHE